MSQSCIRSGGVHVSVSCLGFASYRMAFHVRFHRAETFRHSASDNR